MNHGEQMGEQQLKQLLLQTSCAILHCINTTYSAIESLAPGTMREKDPEMDADAAELMHTYYQLHRMGKNLSEAAEPGVGNTQTNEDVVDQFRLLCSEVKPMVEAQGISFSCTSAVPSCIIGAEGDRLNRLLLNLLSNAIKFTPQGGKISVKMDVQDGFFVLRVEDTGCGMDPEELETAFDRYTRPQWDADRRFGLGLGLTICRRIAREHGGELRLESRKGEGTTAIVTLAQRETCVVDMRKRQYIYSGGFDMALLELSDALPDEAYREENFLGR